MAIELAYDNGWELTSTDAEILIQVRSESILRQKKCLLNIASESVPAECKKIAWLDCDVIFQGDDWVPKTIH